MPVALSKTYQQKGLMLIELPFMLLMTALMLKTLWAYQQQYQQQFLQIEWQQQAWRLAYYSLEAARSQQGKPTQQPPLPAGRWQRHWQTSPLQADCQRLTVTITAPRTVQAQLSTIWCPAPLIVDNCAPPLAAILPQ